MLHISEALGEVAHDLQLEVVLPMHPSPWVRESIRPALAANSRVKLIEPLGYLDFIATLADASLVVTDSGGVLEEAAALHIPALVARNTTERPEAMEANCARLVGTDPRQLGSVVREMFTDPAAHSQMARAVNPFGDGRAALRISERLLADLTVDLAKMFVRD